MVKLTATDSATCTRTGNKFSSFSHSFIVSYAQYLLNTMTTQNPINLDTPDDHPPLDWHWEKKSYLQQSTPQHPHSAKMAECSTSMTQKSKCLQAKLQDVPKVVKVIVGTHKKG